MAVATRGKPADLCITIWIKDDIRIRRFQVNVFRHLIERRANLIDYGNLSLRIEVFFWLD